jgi:hypothetical protein
MSAFVVSPTHIDVLLSVALHGPSDGTSGLAHWSPPYLDEATAALSATTATVLGAGLLAECIASVSHRYPDSPLADLPGPLPMPVPSQYEFTDFGACLTIAEACSAIDCFEYQSCEHPAWSGSPSERFCSRLRASLTAALPGTADAPWEWSPETLAERGLIPLGLGALRPKGARDGR